MWWGEYSRPSIAQTPDAIAAAQQRADTVDAVGNEILARKAMLSDLLVREEGKALPNALASTRPGMNLAITRQPVGVVAIPAWTIAPALAYGNAVVFKPAELVPCSAQALAATIRHRAPSTW